MTFSHPKSFLRESGKLYVLYMVAGVAAIPAGALYAILAVKGYNGWWTALPAIVFGFWMAKEAWSFVERKLFTADFAASGQRATWFPAKPTLAVADLTISRATVPPARPIPCKPQHQTGVGSVVTSGQSEQFTQQPPVLTGGARA